ncbi:6-hydroxymethylpterin diphosphokinase MptE-like protein [Magnetospirillum gryphiswaldense]|uniref:6-hydroxymethylpterin diphosphokinase MptE-like domain-containing protein n=1 Tax=Magnetospirillum gryphiswaldense TaxID=55518 RepID=A4U179_9PROT|nr:6-hydroxymethylpterin diphosphokinase MptE-like protein [Magnetospirillum gryphiswaldense]AVM75583.1 hypothetical protein MSR1_31170 [Magnetospirillum gryphiswaldense MSR-1]AVM79486.1 hypothetical protein MSR1L_31170 [Magnetospirillum gryphiswaldense]CAM76636.1 hypothetical protein MGR_1166 [Magnetospirillum gryphiswaldense MSR-1]
MPEAKMEGGELALRLLGDMEQITWERHGQMALDNAKRNLALLDKGQSLAALRDVQIGTSDQAVVIAAGPSIRRHDPIARIKKANFQGAVIATDSAVAYCLRNGVIPDLVVTLDPHAKRIVRWFGDPDLTEDAIRNDDYYRRQDMDTAFADEMRYNREMLALLDEHGHKMRIAVSTSASEAVVNRVTSTGMKLYWWNPMLDDPDKPDSASRILYGMNRLPLVNAGGNVGSACWMMAHAVLGKSKVALTGMDFAYYDDTPYSATQYYREALDLVGEENLHKLFVRIFNPYTNAWFYTDPAYYWYRTAFLDMVTTADCQTFNCTEGGILFGDGIDFCSLDSFLTHE